MSPSNQAKRFGRKVLRTALGSLGGCLTRLGDAFSRAGSIDLERAEGGLATADVDVACSSSADAEASTSLVRVSRPADAHRPAPVAEDAASEAAETEPQLDERSAAAAASQKPLPKARLYTPKSERKHAPAASQERLASSSKATAGPDEASAVSQQARWLEAQERQCV